MGISEILPFISFGSTIVAIVVAFVKQASDETRTQSPRISKKHNLK